VRGSPWEEDVNNRFRDALASLIEFLGALGFHAEELREGQPEAAKHSYIEELTPRVIAGKWVAGTRYIFHGLTYAEMLIFLRHFSYIVSYIECYDLAKYRLS
jgi:hypothetical protein